MGALSKKLRNVSSNTRGKAIAHWCPGCDECHVIYYESTARPVWTWDGNVDAPTVTPSVLIWTPLKDGTRRTECHYFLKAGQIQFLGDCAHALAGKTVPLPDWPIPDGEYGGVEP